MDIEQLPSIGFAPDSGKNTERQTFYRREAQDNDPAFEVVVTQFRDTPTVLVYAERPPTGEKLLIDTPITTRIEDFRTSYKTKLGDLLARAPGNK